MADTIFTRPTLTLPSPSAPDFLEKVKTLLDLREGHTRDQDERFVTMKQLKVLGTGGSVGGTVIIGGGGISDPGGGADATPPSPPTNLVIQNDVLSHTLTWTNPTESDFSHIEVWRSLTQDRTQAQCVGIATKPTETITLNGVSPRLNYYYWIRAIDTSGNYSLWTPNDLMGGELIAGEFAQSINSMLSELMDDTRYLTNHTIVADSFKIIQPNAGLTTGKSVFAVGNINGTPSVGISGNLIIDGSIVSNALHTGVVTADKIGAGAVTAVKVAANAINGDHIAATSSIKLLEGGKLTVGNNNIILDSTTDQIIVAPDNGTVVGTPNLSGVNYCTLANGDLEFMYWNGSTHILYNSVKRIESAAGCVNNVKVTVPGIWKKTPKIIVSPHSLQTFHKNYVGYNQKLNCAAQSITRSSSGVVQFTPVANLSLSDGVVFSDPNITYDAPYFDPGSTAWYAYKSDTWSSAPDTVKIYLGGFVYVRATAKPVDATIEVYIDGVLKYSTSFYFQKSAWNAPIDEAKPWSCTISSLSQGTHSIYLIGRFHHNTSDNDDLYWGYGCNSMACYQGTFTQLASGTLSYIAIGE